MPIKNISDIAAAFINLHNFHNMLLELHFICMKQIPPPVLTYDQQSAILDMHYHSERTIELIPLETSFEMKVRVTEVKYLGVDADVLTFYIKTDMGGNITSVMSSY